MNAKRLLNSKPVLFLVLTLTGAVLSPRSFSATLTVTNLADSGPGSLRQALADNFTLGGGHTIVFSNVPAGTITLTVELTASAPVIIRGPGPDRVAVSGNQNRRVFVINQGPTEISGLTIRDGVAVGGSGSQGNNGDPGLGGGIFSQATLTLSNCVVRSNSVVGGMGGERHMAGVGNGGPGLGGGIYTTGQRLVLVHCFFDGNSAAGGQGGSAQNGNAGNGGDGLGGAIYTTPGTNELVACSIANGLAVGGPGGVSGGGANGLGGQGYGGGLHSESTFAVRGSTFSGNAAVGGTGAGSGIGFGGGIYSLGTLGVTNSTVAGNQADFGGGMYGNATAANSLLAANTAATGPDVNGAIASMDYNLIQNISGFTLAGATNHVLTGQDPLLGPLAANGGPTPTRALRFGSPAIDQGSSFGAATDQRGALRPFDFASVTNAGGGDGTDIGAFELGVPVLKIFSEPPDVVLSWPGVYGDFELEAVATLGGLNDWAGVPGIPVAGLGGQFYVTNNAGTGSKFYRLKTR